MHGRLRRQRPISAVIDRRTGNGSIGCLRPGLLPIVTGGRRRAVTARLTPMPEKEIVMAPATSTTRPKRADPVGAAPAAGDRVRSVAAAEPPAADRRFGIRHPMNRPLNELE